MHPVICQIGPLTVYSFGLMLAIAVLVCSILLARDAKAVNIAPDVIYDFSLWMIVAGIIGSRVFFIFLNLPDFVADPQQIFMVQNGGLAWQGGLVFGCLAGILFARKKKLSLRMMADLAAPYLALGQAIGRLGCFFNGCCYGKPVAWGLYFPVHHAHLYPTQLFDTVMLGGIFFILKAYRKHAKIQGEVFVLYLILAALERFINEFFRGDHINTAVGLSIFQIVSLIILIIGIYLWRRLHRQTHRV